MDRRGTARVAQSGGENWLTVRPSLTGGRRKDTVSGMSTPHSLTASLVGIIRDTISELRRCGGELPETDDFADKLEARLNRTIQERLPGERVRDCAATASLRQPLFGGAMTRSLFVVQHEDGEPICARSSHAEAVSSARYQSATPDPRIVEYVPRVRCDECSHWGPHECPQCPPGYGFCEDGEQRAPDWYCADHKPRATGPVRSADLDSAMRQALGPCAEMLEELGRSASAKKEKP